MANLADLHEELLKVCPVVTLRGKTGAEPSDIVFEAAATPEQRAAALALVKSFDWSREKPKPQLPLTDKEIQWIREQMKAQTDALR